MKWKIFKLPKPLFVVCKAWTRDWNWFYDNRIYQKSIRIDFKIDYRIKLKFTYCGAVLEKFNGGHLINCYTENVSLKTGYYADYLSF